MDSVGVYNMTAFAANLNSGNDHGDEKGTGWAKPEPFDYDTYNRANEKPSGNDKASAIDNPSWSSTAARYEWSEDFGDIGPKHAELEEMLFGSELRVAKGSQIDNIEKLQVTLECEKKLERITSFEEAGLHPVMLENVKLCGYDRPTPIQSYVLPAVFKNKDVIGIAQTGSGKTAAFLIPTLSKLMGKAKKLAAPRPNLATEYQMRVQGEPLLLVVCPTRELACQIFDEARRLCYRSMLRPCVVYGGAPVRDQIDEVRKGCDVLVATPGRLIDFLERSGVLSLRRCKYTIIDEADEMVDMNWEEDMKKIMGGDANADDDHLYMMFSATFPAHARHIARTYMAKDHVRIRVGRAGSSHRNIIQKVIQVDESKKRQCLSDWILSMPPTRIMIFVNSKKSADLLDDYLFNLSLPCTSIHADRTQLEREDAMRAFRTAKAPILIATGASGRGLDVKEVMHVINYDLPSAAHGGIHEYTHRIGRTARIGNVGIATSFYNERNDDIAGDLVKVLLEQGQEVPDFLEAYRPQEGDLLDFGDESEEENVEVGVNGHGANGVKEVSLGGFEASTGDGAEAGW